MLTNQKPTGMSSGIPGGLALGVLAAMVLTVLLGCLLAVLIAKEVLPEENVGYGVMAVLFVSSAIGSTVAYKRIRHRRLMVFVLSGICYLVTLTGLTALFFGGQYEGIFPTAMLIIGGTGVAFLRSASMSRGWKPHKKSRHFR